MGEGMGEGRAEGGGVAGGPGQAPKKHYQVTQPTQQTRRKRTVFIT